MKAKVPRSFYVHISSEQPNQLLIKTDEPMGYNWLYKECQNVRIVGKKSPYWSEMYVLNV